MLAYLQSLSLAPFPAALSLASLYNTQLPSLLGLFLHIDVRSFPARNIAAPHSSQIDEELRDVLHPVVSQRLHLTRFDLDLPSVYHT